MTAVKIHGRAHEIPDIWLATFCTRNGYTVQQAIEWWDWQAQIDALGEWIDAPESLRGDNAS
jgi:hypothetical protein